MNPKSVAIIVIVAIAVAGISYGTYLMDSDEKLELRDYLVEGDWVEYYHENPGYSVRHTVLDVDGLDLYEINISEDNNVSVSYMYLFTIVDPNDKDVEYLGSKTMDTLLGNIECDVYHKTSFLSELIYYVEPDTNLVLITDSTDYDGNTYRTKMTGTSLFDPFVPELVKIGIAQLDVGSSLAFENRYYYNSDDRSLSGNMTSTMTVDSVNADGTLNLIDEEEPVTVEQFMSGIVMTDEEMAASTLVEAKTVSTQWGVMMCHIYAMQYHDPVSGEKWEKTFIVEPRTGVVLKTAIEMHDFEFEEETWYYGESVTVLTDCNLIFVTD